MIKNLKMDIKNAANHVFGDHKKCAAYYCKPESILLIKTW